MHYSLIFAVAIAVLGFASAAPPGGSNEEKVCEFLKGIETARHSMLESISRKAASFARATIRSLPENSCFEKSIKKDITYSYLTSSDEQMIKFVRKVKCVYKQKILWNSNFSNQPKYLEEYKKMKTERSDIVTNFDNELVEKSRSLYRRMSRTSGAIQQYLEEAIEEFVELDVWNRHERFIDFVNSAKSKYECTYKIGYL